MNSQQFQSLSEHLHTLNFIELKRVRHQVEQMISSNHLGHVMSDCEERINHCPYCAHNKFIRYGTTARGQQRYKCKACNKTFNTLTGTALARLRNQDKWLQYSDGMWLTEKLRPAAKKLCINFKTAFRWRHKLLAHPTESRCQPLAGIIEADETFLNESFKGRKKSMTRKSRKRGGGKVTKVPVFLALDRQGHVAHQVLEADTKEELSAAITPILTPESVLCTDGNLSYQAIVKRLPYELEHKRLISLDNERVKDGIYHIQTLNNWIMRWKAWLVQFRGVGTAYLEHYLAWFRQMDSFKEEQPSWVDVAIMSNITNT